MTRSKIFSTPKHRRIEKQIVALLNAQPDFLSARTVSSTRAVGDAIQTILAEQFQSLLGNLAGEYSSEFARRSMADLAFTDKDGFYPRG